MNKSHVSAVKPSRVEPENKPDTPLHGFWLIIARIVWIALVLFILACIIASIPSFRAFLQNDCSSTTCHSFLAPETVQQIRTAGVSVTFDLSYQYALFVIFELAFLSIGAVIFWLKSNDRMALYTSFALVTFSMAFNSGSLVAFVPAAWLPIQIINFIGSVSLGIFFYLFPNGRFVPRWTRWLIVGWVVYAGVITFFPNPSGTSWLIIVFNLLLPCLLVSAVGAQVYRYWRVSSVVERQQTKWVVFGASIGLIGFLLVVTLYFYNVLSLFQLGPPLDFIAGMALDWFILLIPLSIAFAILRSRLWDIDILINRTLVYGMLTLSLALVYFGLIFVMQFLLQGLFTPNNGVVIVVSTLTIYALFQPLRRRIQQVIDRRFYRRKYDADKIVKAFSATLRNEVDMATLREQLLAVVQETMQPAHISLWLRPPTHNGTQEFSSRANPQVLSKVEERNEW